MDVGVAYANDLSTLNQGYALWRPEPHDTGEVRIGDVGHVNEHGTFRRLLNAREQDSLYENYKVTWWAQPAVGMEPLEERRIRIEDMPNSLVPGRKYLSRGIEDTSVQVSANIQTPAGAGGGLNATYKCHKEHGAIITWDGPANRAALVDTQYLRDYVLRNHASWVSYAKKSAEEGGLELPVTLEDADIVFVRGVTKADSTWEAVAFGSSYSEHGGGANVDAGMSASVKLIFTRRREKMPPVLVRRGAARIQRLAGPDAHQAHEQDNPMAQEAPLRDQTIFIDRYMIKKNLFGALRIRGGGGDRPPPHQQGERSDFVLQMGGDEENEARLQQAGNSVDPLKILLDYILQAPNAAVAIASDSDVKNVLLGRDWPDDLAATLRELQPRVDVHDGYGMLSFTDKIRREQTHRFSDRKIVSLDRQKFPNISLNGAGTPEDGCVFFDLAQPNSFPADWLYLKFSPRNPETGVISSFALSPDSALLAAAWDSNAITVWRLADGLTVQRLRDDSHTGIVWAVWSTAFSPDSTRIISGSANMAAVIWDVRSGQAVSYLRGHSAGILAVTYSPDGALIATSSADRSVKVWDASRATTLHTIALTASSWRILFSPDGSRLSACRDNSATIWNPHTGTQVATLSGHSSTILCMAFSPDGMHIVTGSEDTSARIWDASSGKELVAPAEFASPVWSVAFSPDSAEIVAVTRDGAVSTRDLFTGEWCRERSKLEALPANAAMVYSAKTDFVASGSADGHVRVWNAKSGDFIVEFQGHTANVRGLVFTADGWGLVSSADDNSIRSWSVFDALRSGPPYPPAAPSQPFTATTEAQSQPAAAERSQASGSTLRSLFRRRPTLSHQSKPVDVSVTYANDLLTLNHGHALWQPEPHITGEVHIGDVGFVNPDGAFVRLLNVRERDPHYSEYRVTFWTPYHIEGVEPLEESKVRIVKTLNGLPPGHYLSRGVEQTSAEASASQQVVTGVGDDKLSAPYKCHEEHGAVLELSSPTIGEELVDNEYLQDYVRRYHASWARYARDIIGLRLEDVEIVFIKGFTKTTATWKATVIALPTSTDAVGATNPMYARKPGGLSKWRRGGEREPLPAQHLVGRQGNIATEEAGREDQSVFIRYYKVKKQLFGGFAVQAV